MADKTRAEELFDDFKKKALDDEKSGTESFDKNLLTFSSGALGLSLAFIKDIVPLSMAHWIACLFVSWIDVHTLHHRNDGILSDEHSRAQAINRLRRSVLPPRQERCFQRASQDILLSSSGLVYLDC